MIYRESGFPYSDELYHHGILGQKWGVRRYQNTDGTLTAAGKVRYGISQVGKAIGSKIKSGIDKRKENNKKKHPERMTDEELQSAIKRLEMEKRYSDMMKNKKTQTSRGKRVAEDILESGAKTIANAAFNSLANNAFGEKVDKNSMSYRLKKDFENEFNKKYKPGKIDTIPNDYSDWESRLESIRKIEGISNNKQGKKRNK